MPFKMSPQNQNGPIWVAFCDAPGVGWLQILRPGFRHCFLVMQGRDAWVSVDPLFGRLEIMTHPFGRTTPLPHQLRQQGLTLVKIHENAITPRGLGAVLCTCVGIVKRTVGLTDPWVWTPYQLYRALLNRGATPLTLEPGDMTS